MLQYVLAGLALGSIYAIAASALVVTFVSSGVLNFAFGSMAYVVARFYYWLNSQHHMSTVAAGSGLDPGAGAAHGRVALRRALPVRPGPVDPDQDW